MSDIGVVVMRKGDEVLRVGRIVFWMRGFYSFELDSFSKVLWKRLNRFVFSIRFWY